MSEPRNPVLPYLAFTTLGLIWGASFLFIKLGVRDMSPTALALIRSAAGAITLGVILLAMRRPLFGRDWRQRVVPFTIMAFTNAVLPWSAIAWGEQHISSGLASILNSTTTLWAAILIYWVIPSERPSAINFVGVAIGLAGVAILVLPDIASHGVTGSFFGALAVVGAAVAYAVSALFQRLRLKGMSVYEQSFGQLAFSAVLALPVAAPSLHSFHFAWLSMGAVIALGVGGSGIAYLLYYYSMNTLGAVRATGVTFVVPITAVFWGVVLLHETLSAPVVIGMFVILGGVVLTNLRPKTSRAVGETQAA